MSDAEIVERVLRGDSQAFADLVFRYQGMVFSVCLIVAGERSAAEDLAQEIFLKQLHLGTVLVAVAMIAFGVWLIRSQQKP